MKKLFQLIILVLILVPVAAHFLLPTIYQSNLDQFIETARDNGDADITYGDTESGLFGSSYTAHDVTIKSVDPADPDVSFEVNRLELSVNAAAYIENLQAIVMGQGIQTITRLTLVDTDMNADIPQGGQLNFENIILRDIDVASIEDFIAEQSNATEPLAAEELPEFPIQGIEIIDLTFVSETANVNLSEMSYDFSDDNIFNMSIQKLNIQAVAEQLPVVMTLENLSVNDLYMPEFPMDLEALQEMQQMQEDPEVAAKALAEYQQGMMDWFMRLHVDNVTMNKFNVKSEGFFEVALENLSHDVEGRTGLKDYFFATSTQSRIDGFEVNIGPVGAILMASLAPNVPTSYRLDAEASNEWDLDTGDVSGSSSMAIADLMSMSIDLNLVGMTEGAYVAYLDAMMTNTEMANPEADPAVVFAHMFEQLQDVGIQQIDVGLSDLGALDLVSELMAMQTGLPKETMPIMWKGQLSAVMVPVVAQTPALEPLATSLGAFLDGSKELRLRLAPEQAVYMKALQALDMNTPDALPALIEQIGFEVETVDVE